MTQDVDTTPRLKNVEKRLNTISDIEVAMLQNECENEMQVPNLSENLIQGNFN